MPEKEKREQLETDSKEANENKVEARSVIAALSMLTPLLVSCMDDDWNADVRFLAVGVVRQFFFDLNVSPWYLVDGKTPLNAFS